MKLIRSITCLATSLLASTLSFAEGSLSPGWYIGIMGGGGIMESVYFPATTLVFDTSPPYLFGLSSGRASSGILGNLGLQLGYRYCNFRFEGEFLYGFGKFRKIELFGDSSDGGALTIPAGTYDYNTTYFFDTVIPNIAAFKLKYKRFFYAGFANLIYDFYSYDSDWNIVPYAGLGIGALHVEDQLSLTISTIEPASITAKHKAHYSAPLAQAIIGATYLINDCSNLGLDFRYIVSSPINRLNDDRISIYTLNLVFNYTFSEV